MFINLLRTEKNIIRVEIIQNLAGHPPPAQRTRYVDANQRILAIVDDFQNRGNMEYLPAIAHNLGFWFCFSSFLKTIRKKVVLALFVLLYKKSCVFKEYFFYFPAFKLTSWRNIFSSEGPGGGSLHSLYLIEGILLFCYQKTGKKWF